MKKVLCIPLWPSPEQAARLRALQMLFAQVCNILAPKVRDSRCWNRVVLHHMVYKPLREQFPALGAQMACNAIYAVCRASRVVYQHPQSPFFIGRASRQPQPLPLLHFADNAPVHFDWNTVSVKGSQLSVYTLDGRMRFQLALRPEDEVTFATLKVTEIMLFSRIDDRFELVFVFADDELLPDLANPNSAGFSAGQADSPAVAALSLIPDYIDVEELS